MSLGEKIVVQILGEKQILQADGPTINAKHASTVTKFCKNKSTNDQIIKKLGSDILITTNCESLKVPILSPDILTNKKIGRFYKTTINNGMACKIWFFVKNNSSSYWKYVSSGKKKAIDPITLVNWTHLLMTSKWKDYQNLREQDHSGSVYLLGHNLSESSDRIRAIHLFEFIYQKTTPPFATLSRSPLFSNNFHLVGQLLLTTKTGKQTISTSPANPTRTRQTVIYTAKRNRVGDLEVIKQFPNPAGSFWKGFPRISHFQADSISRCILLSIYK